MIPVISVLGYKEVCSLLRNINYQPKLPAKIEIHNILHQDAVDLAKKLDRQQQADVFVSSGSNFILVSPHITTPLVEIQLTGIDVLLALKKARSHTSRVGVISYRKKIPFLSSVKEMISVDITEISYTDAAQIESLLIGLRERGINTVLGGSFVTEAARRLDMNGVLLYSPDGIIRALDNAVQIAYSKRKELEKSSQLQAILDFAYSGIVATDGAGDITVFNSCAEKITGISARDALGKPIEKILPTTRLTHIINNGIPEFNKIQSIGNVKILTNRIPIIINKSTIGTVATFQDIQTVHESDVQIRKNLYTKGFIAKTYFDDLVGEAPCFLSAKQTAARYAANDFTILINGESGTGKELFAQGIHNASPRSSQPFVGFNCAAITDSLLESELFGYEEGSFTGAKKGGRNGLFELAHLGTIFLDEIAEIPIAVQARLLRVLEQKEVMRVGGGKIIPVDIKVICATNKNLKEMVEQGAFRSDLYYRLNVLELEIPPLRSRASDIPLLVKQFLSEIRPDFTSDLLERIARHPAFIIYGWPGNIRELKNIVQRFSVLYAKGEPYDALLTKLILERDMPIGATDTATLEHVLRQFDGNRTKAARALGISRMTLWRKLREH